LGAHPALFAASILSKPQYRWQSFIARNHKTAPDKVRSPGWALTVMTPIYAINIADRFVLSTFIEPIKHENGRPVPMRRLSSIRPARSRHAICTSLAPIKYICVLCVRACIGKRSYYELDYPHPAPIGENGHDQRFISRRNNL
jgi:hypothetical protein